MDREQRERVFRRGVALSRKGALSEAALLFRRLVDQGTEDPLHLSYCGLLMAVVHGKDREGLQLCERALSFGAYEPEVVLNLARLYERLGLPQKAVKLLRRGLREKPRHREMLGHIDRLSPRRRPPLSFVHRDQFLNKRLAILLAKLRRSGGPAETMHKVQSMRRHMAARRLRTATRRG